MQEWICVRQRAGPLVKECRALRPRLSANDTPYQRSEKIKSCGRPETAVSAERVWTGWSCGWHCFALRGSCTR